MLSACSRGDDACVLVNGLQELSDHQGDGLNPLDLLLSSNQFPFQVLLLILDIFLLQLQELQMALQVLVPCVEII